jgi:hypothetical protein
MFDDSDTAEIEELSESELSDIEDKIDSHEWYTDHGWDSQAAETEAELESVFGEFDSIAELKAIVDQRDPITKTEERKQIEELESAIQWWRDHDWHQAADDGEERLKRLKSQS